MHTTKEPLASMSLEELRAEQARQEDILNTAKASILLCKQAIADKIAEFSIGDRVTDRKCIDSSVFCGCVRTVLFLLETTIVRWRATGSAGYVVLGHDDRPGDHGDALFPWLSVAKKGVP